MALFADAMARVNARLLTEFPDEILFNSVAYPCIAPPLDIFKTMNPQTYDAKVTFSFQMLETTRAAAKINLKDTLEFETPYAAQFGKTRLEFQVANFLPDKNDSMVRLVCTLKQ